MDGFVTKKQTEWRQSRDSHIKRLSGLSDPNNIAALGEDPRAGEGKSSTLVWWALKIEIMLNHGKKMLFLLHTRTWVDIHTYTFQKKNINKP